jgi:serine/threonine protein kinase
MIEVCEGLEHLHDLNILHRDLKIENVFVKIKEDGKP